MSPTINYKGKHHVNGDELPPFNGKPRLFNMRMCPYAHRAILAFNAKQVDYEIVNLCIVKKPNWVFTKNPFGKIPILEVEDGVTICESLLTVEYIDDVYPQRPLLPQDPLKRVQDKMFVAATEPMEVLYIRLAKFPHLVTEEGISAYHKILLFIQDELKARRSKFLSGSQPGYADYMIWPWLERFAIDDDKRVTITKDKHELLLQYIADMFQDPVVKTYRTPLNFVKKINKESKLGTFCATSLDTMEEIFK